MPAELSPSSRVEFPDDVLCQELQGEAVLLNLKTGVYLGLDAVGNRVWQLLHEHRVLGKVVAAMLDEYDVTEDRCLQDLIALVSQMEEHGLVRIA